MLNEETKQAIASTDASIKDASVSGVWKIEDAHERASISNSTWSRSYRKNTSSAAESEIVLNLIETVVWSMREWDEGKRKAHEDFHKAQALTIADELKVS